MDETIETYFTAENLFDKDPPFIVGTRGAGFYAGQGNTGLYDRPRPHLPRRASASACNLR